ncbi:hypothetical protein [Acinetobacter baumannii]|uniref:hypothetical protein n=1 Tax=Acinetobacter baumannii TaxID=470 RepID=UPI00148AD15D|nr:hypothetical protein [Acinetobacter baumannii]
MHRTRPPLLVVFCSHSAAVLLILKLEGNCAVDLSPVNADTTLLLLLPLLVLGGAATAATAAVEDRAMIEEAI